MIGDAFVFDGVAHPFNFTPKNAYGAPGQMFANHLYAFHATLTPEDHTHLSSEEFLKFHPIQQATHSAQSHLGMVFILCWPTTRFARSSVICTNQSVVVVRERPKLPACRIDVCR